LVHDFAGQCWLWQLLNRTFVVAALGFQPIWWWGDLGFSSFFNQIPHKKEHEISVGIFSPR
jgi:hypothetical protein